MIIFTAGAEKPSEDVDRDAGEKHLEPSGKSGQVSKRLQRNVAFE